MFETESFMAVWKEGYIHKHEFVWGGNIGLL